MRRREAGYTLMEVLVMLAVSALVATVVFDSVRRASALALRVEQASREATGAYDDFAAFRRAVRSLRTQYAELPGAFEGDPAGFTALAGEPVGAPPGELRVVTARLEEGRDGALELIIETGAAELAYADAPEALRRRHVIRRWEDATGAFDYLPASPNIDDPAGLALGLSSAGPPPDWMRVFPGDHGFAQGYFVEVPGAVRLTVETPNGRHVHIFHPSAGAAPPPRASDIFGSETPP